MAIGMKEYWVMHRPRHPLWGNIMFGLMPVKTAPNPSGVVVLANPIYVPEDVANGEKDFLYYKYQSNYYVVTEKPWLLHTVCYSIEDTIAAAKRMISYVGQDHVRIAQIINAKVKVEI